MIDLDTEIWYPYLASVLTSHVSRLASCVSPSDAGDATVVAPSTRKTVRKRASVLTLLPCSVPECPECRCASLLGVAGMLGN